MTVNERPPWTKEQQNGVPQPMQPGGAALSWEEAGMEEGQGRGSEHLVGFWRHVGSGWLLVLSVPSGFFRGCSWELSFG